jgi:hypothetical protein
MEVECSSETSEYTFITRPGNPKENHKLINNSRENLKNYKTRQAAGIKTIELSGIRVYGHLWQGKLR